jgi:uncharacterized Zn finger protein
VSFYDWGWEPRPSVRALRTAAKREAEKLRKKGQALEPIVIAGRAITSTFWGNSWCKNLERYGDFENRLPRGRSYVRNGLVLHLAIKPGAIEALVRGSSLYKTSVAISPISRRHWKSVCTDLVGSVDSLVELLQGRLSAAVMERICRQGTGLFPTPREIRFDCSCPDYASMCKHAAAVLYGVGARLDEQPDLLFALREVDASDLIATADRSVMLGKRGPRRNRVLARANLSELFGLEMVAASGAAAAVQRGDRRRVARRKDPKTTTKAKRTAEARALREKPTQPVNSHARKKPRSSPKRGTA